MLGSIGQTHRIHSNPTSRQRYTAQNSTTQSSGMFFAANQPEEKKVAKSSHRNFSDIPQELLNKIGDFLGSEEVLKCMLPLSKKVFQNIFNENFKLRILRNTSFLEIGYKELKIGYKEFLSNKILELKQELGDRDVPLPTWTRLHYASTVVQNVPNALIKNLKNRIPIEDLEFVMCLLTIPTIVSLLIWDVALGIPFTKILVYQFLEQTHSIEISIALLVMTFIFFEFKNPQIPPTTEQKSSIAHRVTLKNLEKHLPELVQLYESISKITCETID